MDRGRWKGFDKGKEGLRKVEGVGLRDSKKNRKAAEGDVIHLHLPYAILYL